MNKKQIKTILLYTCEHFEIELDNLIGKPRKRKFVYPRFHLIQILKIKTVLSLSEIGKIVGGRDHSTIIHALETHKDLRDQDTSFMIAFDEYHKFYNKTIAPIIGFKPKQMTQEQLKEYGHRMEEILEREQCLMKEKELLILEILNS